MSKNYILEPIELFWISEVNQYDVTPQTGLFDTSLLNENVICEVSDGTLLKYAGEYEGFTFNIDGGMVKEQQFPIVIYYDDEEGVYLCYQPEGEPATPTVTVSIYTEEDDPEPAPTDNPFSKNIVHNDHPYNAVERIRAKLKQKVDEGEDEEESGEDEEESGGDEGGGTPSGGGIMKLTFTEDPNNAGTFVCDHTWQEIYDAINAGRYVTFTEIDNFDESTYIQNGISMKIVTKAGHAEINDAGGYQSFYYINNDSDSFNFTADSADGYPSYTE